MKNWKKIRLVGKKVFLRPLRKTDAKCLFELVNNPDVTKFLAFDVPLSLKREKRFAAKSEQYWQQSKGFTFAICEKSSGELVGCCGLDGFDKKHQNARLGIWVGKRYWSQGFGSEAVFLAFKFGFEKLKLNRIEYGVFPQNKRSQLLIKQTGAKLEGKKRQAFFKRGKFYDELIYAMLASEWKGKTPKKKVKKWHRKNTFAK